MATSTFLMVTAGWLMASTQPASHGAGHNRPVNSGKLFVACNRSLAARQSSRETRSFHSGIRLPQRTGLVAERDTAVHAAIGLLADDGEQRPRDVHLVPVTDPLLDGPARPRLACCSEKTLGIGHGRLLAVFPAYAWRGRASSGGTLASTIRRLARPHRRHARPSGRGRLRRRARTYSTDGGPAEATVRTWFHSGPLAHVHGPVRDGLRRPGLHPASALLRGTFAAIVTPNEPNRYSALPSSSSTAPSSGHSTNVTTAITAHSTADPMNTNMKGGRTAVTLIACMAATPCAGGSAASPRITKVENPQKTPATSPVPSTPAPRVRSTVPRSWRLPRRSRPSPPVKSLH